MFKNKPNFRLYSFAAIVFLFVIVVFFVVKRNKEKKEIAEIVNYEKQQLEAEYVDWTFQTESKDITIGNDSLSSLLDDERMKVLQLLDELKSLKSTNVRRMNELRKELLVVRQVMMHYVAQIDSLNSENKKLSKENEEIKKQNKEFEKSLMSLSEEKNTLIKRMHSAAMLETTNIQVVGFNNLGRQTNLVHRIVSLQCCFSILKNKTATVGNKTIYLRIVPPNGKTLITDTLSVFKYEDKKIPFSCQKGVEYEGENVDVCLYWQATQPLIEGVYRIEIFVDGNLIGEKEIEL